MDKNGKSFNVYGAIIKTISAIALILSILLIVLRILAPTGETYELFGTFVCDTYNLTLQMLAKYVMYYVIPILLVANLIISILGYIRHQLRTKQIFIMCAFLFVWLITFSMLSFVMGGGCPGFI